MAFVLNDAFTLEGFLHDPYCLVNERARFTRKLTREEFDLLLRCDGSDKTDELSEDQAHMAHHFVEMGVLSEIDASAQPHQTHEIFYELNEFLHVPAAQIAITGRCNLHCKHCLAAADQNNVATQLTLEECKKIFADMVQARVFNLWITGGEPLVHPQFKEIICAVQESGLHLTRLFTNAALVNEELLDFFEEHYQHPEMVVSFDGLGTHDWMRNSTGAEQRTLEKIDLIRSRGFAVYANVNVNGITAPRIVETCRALVYDHDVHSIRAIYTSPTPRWHEFATDAELLDIDQYYELMIDLLRTSRVEKWPVALDIIHLPHVHMQPTMRAAALLRNPPAPRESRRIMTSCGRATNTMFIGSDGRVLPCSTYEGETAAHGVMMGADINVKTRPLKDILSDSAYVDQHKITIADLWESDPECKGCEWVQLCCGGCPLYTMERKIWDCGNPICHLYKGGYATKYIDMLEETAE